MSYLHVYIIAVDIHVAYIIEIDMKYVTVPVEKLSVRGGGGVVKVRL